MERRFDVLVTVDKHLPVQQRIEGRPFGVVVLRARSNRLGDLLPLLPRLVEILDEIAPGIVKEIVS